MINQNMTKQLYFQILRRHYWLVIISVLLAMALAFFLTMLFPLNYSSTTQVMIIQKQLTESDSYLAAKASEKVAANLAQVMYSTSFLQAVNESALADLTKINSLEESDKRKAWGKAISAEVIPNTGILQITAYQTNPAQAEQLASALAATIVARGSEYHGGGENIELKQINAPLTSKYPVQPNLLANLSLAALLGLIGSMVYLFLRPEVAVSMIQASASKKSAPAIIKPAKKIAAVPVVQPEAVEVPELRPAIENLIGVPVLAKIEPPLADLNPLVNYSVLDHKTYPQYDTNNYSQAPRVATMLDHLPASTQN